MSKGGGQTPAGDYLMSVLPQNYAAAQKIAAKPFTPYMGQLVAHPTAATQQGQAAITSGALTAGQPTLNSAIAGATNVRNYAPVQVNAPTAKATLGQVATSGVYGVAPQSIPRVAAMQGLQGIDAYFNPYVSQVADRTLADLDRFRQMAVNQNASDATMSSAFGGDRQAVTDALTNEAFARQAATALAGLYSQGFDASSGLLMSDKDRLLQNQQFNAGLQQQMNLANMGAANQFALANQAVGLQAGLANQSAGLQGAQANLAGSQLLGNLANQQQQQLLTGANAITGVGLQQQAQQQAQLDAAYQQFLRELGYPYQQQDVLNKALGMFGTMQGQYSQPSYPLADLFGGMGNAIGGASAPWWIS